MRSSIERGSRAGRWREREGGCILRSLSWHRWPWAGLALLGLRALTRELHAEAQPTPAKAWWFRLGGGLGSPVQSQQELLVDAEGYSGGRSHLSARAASSLGEH